MDRVRLLLSASVRDGGSKNRTRQKRPQVPFEIQETRLLRAATFLTQKKLSRQKQAVLFVGQIQSLQQAFQVHVCDKEPLHPSQPGGKRGREVMGGCWGSTRLWAAWQHTESGWAFWGPQAFGGLCTSAYCVLCPVLGLGGATVNKTETKRKRARVPGMW